MSDHNPDLTKMIALLRGHNRWRRGDEEVEMHPPHEIGIAIDAVCSAVDKLASERDRIKIEFENLQFAQLPSGEAWGLDPERKKLERRIETLMKELDRTRETMFGAQASLTTVRKQRDALIDGLSTLHDTAGQRMMADDPTGEERMAFLNAWKAAGELLQEVRGE